MFCDNCGNQLDPSYRYCSMCGKDSQQQPDPTICLTCGAPLIPGAKFCNNCGTVTASSTNTNVKPAVSFCKYCSLEYQPQDRFCKQCGQPKDNGRSSAVASFIAPSNGGGLLHSVNDLHQMILGGLFFILFLLWFIPSIGLGYAGEDYTTSMALPFADDAFALYIGSEGMNIVLTIVTFIIDVIPLLGCVGLSVLAILKGQLNPKFQLIQLIVAGKSVIAPFAYWLIGALMNDTIASTFLTFGGWVIFLLASFTTLAAIWLFLQTKRLQARR